MTYHLTLKEITAVTHDTHRLRFDRPEGFEFVPGQACDLALDREGWREETRPFTFTSAPEDPVLEFTIKSYPEHDSVTKRIGEMEPDDGVLISDAWGAIHDAGPGVFIAGGAGITPFIPILRLRKAKDEAQGCALIYSNKTERDIILREEWEAMEGLRTVFTLTEEKADGLSHGLIDRDFLAAHVGGTDQTFYACGPQEMVDDIVGHLRALGVDPDRIVTED